MIAEGLACGRAAFFGAQTLVSLWIAIHADHQPELRPHLRCSCIQVVHHVLSRMCKAATRRARSECDNISEGVCKGDCSPGESSPYLPGSGCEESYFPAGGKTAMQGTGRRASQDHGCPDREAIHRAQGRHPGEHRAEAG